MFYYFPIRAHTPCSTTGRGKLSGDLAPGFQKQIGPNIPDTSSAQSKSVSVQLSY